MDMILGPYPAWGKGPRLRVQSGTELVWRARSWWVGPAATRWTDSSTAGRAPGAPLMHRAIRFVALLGLGLIVAATLVAVLPWVPAAEAQGEPILSFEGRVTSVSPKEMLVAAERAGVVVDVVMVDLARIPQSETRQIAQDDVVVVIGFIRRPGHKVIATSVQQVSRWFPTTPGWAPRVP
jgi:hypothetical protein